MGQYMKAVENYGLLGKNTLQLKGRNLAGPNLLWAKRTVAAQKCGLLSERGFFWQLHFFTVDFAIFLFAFCWAHFLSFIKLSFWQVFMRGAQTSKKNKSDEERKEKKEDISDKLEIGNC